jgi:hypothetical protein
MIEIAEDAIAFGNPCLGKLATDRVEARMSEKIGIAIAARLPDRSMLGRNGKVGAGESILGYATPTAALVAISFVATFEIERVTTKGGAKHIIQAEMTLSGECAYDPSRNAVSGVEIQGWSQSLKDPAGGFSGSYSAPTSVELRQYSPSHMRRIS